MGKRLHRDIEIRGVIYATANAAAKALGVQPSTVIRAIGCGRLDTLGTGIGGWAPLPVRIRGTVYPSQRHAAEALGVTQPAISYALKEGREDQVGLPPPPPPLNNAKSVTIGSHKFRSMRAASMALGLEQSAVSRAMRGEGFMREKVMAAAMALDARQAVARWQDEGMAVKRPGWVAQQEAA